jgi:PKD repeat protein
VRDEVSVFCSSHRVTELESPMTVSFTFHSQDPTGEPEQAADSV